MPLVISKCSHEQNSVIILYSYNGCKKRVEIIQKTKHPAAETNSLSSHHQFHFPVTQGSEMYERTSENEQLRIICSTSCRCILTSHFRHFHILNCICTLFSLTCSLASDLFLSEIFIIFQNHQ